MWGRRGWGGWGRDIWRRRPRKFRPRFRLLPFLLQRDLHHQLLCIVILFSPLHLLLVSFPFPIHPIQITLLPSSPVGALDIKLALSQEQEGQITGVCSKVILLVCSSIFVFPFQFKQASWESGNAGDSGDTNFTWKVKRSFYLLIPLFWPHRLKRIERMKGAGEVQSHCHYPRHTYHH